MEILKLHSVEIAEGVGNLNEEGAFQLRNVEVGQN